MKERPMLFSGPMVRAVLEGRKTQTRRVIADRHLLGGPPEEALLKMCPYGLAGDALWVKETFFDVSKFKHAPLFAAVVADSIYRADYDYRERKGKIIGCHHWKPSIFMPRRASRILLEVVSVRVERLQQISEADCVAEGVRMGPPAKGQTLIPYKAGYQQLWESINGPESWTDNPWVWVNLNGSNELSTTAAANTSIVHANVSRDVAWCPCLRGNRYLRGWWDE